MGRRDRVTAVDQLVEAQGSRQEQQERSRIVEQPAQRVVELGLCLVLNGKPPKEFF